MRRNGYSIALREYEASLRRAQHLQRLEVSRYRDPPPRQDQVGVEALRGGATVLMVASFERYLPEALEEFVDLVAGQAMVTSHSGLSPNFVEFNDFNYFNWHIRDSRLPRKQKAGEFKACSPVGGHRQVRSRSIQPNSGEPRPDNRERAFP